MEIHSPIAPINPAKRQITSRRPENMTARSAAATRPKVESVRESAMRRRMGDWTRLKDRHKRRNQYRCAHKNSSEKRKSDQETHGMLRRRARKAWT